MINEKRNYFVSKAIRVNYSQISYIERDRLIEFSIWPLSFRKNNFSNVLIPFFIPFKQNHSSNLISTNSFCSYFGKLSFISFWTGAEISIRLNKTFRVFKILLLIGCLHVLQEIIIKNVSCLKRYAIDVEIEGLIICNLLMKAKQLG